MAHLVVKAYQPTPPTPVAAKVVRKFEIALTQGQKGLRVTAVDPTNGKTIAHLAAIRSDGKLRAYEGLPTDLGLDLDSRGCMVVVNQTGR